MPEAKPPEFRRRAVDLARSGRQSVGKVARPNLPGYAEGEARNSLGQCIGP